MVSVNAKYAGIVKKISYANQNSVYATLILKKFPGIIVCSFIIMAGILSLIIYFSSRIKTGHLDDNFKIIGICALCSGLWSINQYDFFSLIVGNAQVSYFVDYYGLFLMPISYSLYIYKLCSERCKRIMVLCAPFILFVLTAFIYRLQGLNVQSISFLSCYAYTENIGYRVIYEIVAEKIQELNYY